MANGAKPPKGLLIAGIVLVVLGIGGCGYGCTNFVGFVGDLTDAVEGRSTVPFGQSTTLQSDAGGAVILTSTPRAECEVVDDSGNQVTLEEPSAGTSGTIDTTSGESLEFQYYFDTDSGVTYEVTCQDGLDGSGEFVVVGFDLGSIVGGLFGIGIGAVLFIIGVILLIVGLVQRSRWKKRGGGTMGGPGGYSPPAPGAPGSYGQQGYGQPGYGQPGGPPPPGQGYPGQAPPPGGMPGPSAPPPPQGPSTPPPPPSGPSSPPPPPQS